MSTICLRIPLFQSWSAWSFINLDVLNNFLLEFSFYDSYCLSESLLFERKRCTSSKMNDVNENFHDFLPPECSKYPRQFPVVVVLHLLGMFQVICFGTLANKFFWLIGDRYIRFQVNVNWISSEHFLLFIISHLSAWQILITLNNMPYIIVSCSVFQYNFLWYHKFFAVI